MQGFLGGKNEQVYMAGLFASLAGAMAGGTPDDIAIANWAGANAAANNHLGNAARAAAKICIQYPGPCLGTVAASAMTGLVNQRAAELQTQYPGMSNETAVSTASAEVQARALVDGVIDTAQTVQSWFTSTPPEQQGSPGYAEGGVSGQPGHTGNTNARPDYDSGTTAPAPAGQQDNATPGYGAGDAPDYSASTYTPNDGPGGPNVMVAVPPSILGPTGTLPPGIGGPGTPIPMPASHNPNQTAEEFARAAFNGQKPESVTSDGGGWLAKLPDGTTVLYRPAGQATRTDPSTASVDINNSSIRGINNDKPAKFKFPKH